MTKKQDQKLLRGGQLPATVQFRERVRSSDRISKEQTVRLFNINYHTLEKTWRPKIWQYLREDLPIRQNDGSQLKFWQLSRTNKDIDRWIDMITEKVLYGIPELNFPDIDAAEQGRSQEGQDATDDRRIELSVPLLVAVVKKMVKQEMADMKKKQDLQSEYTEDNVATKQRKRQRSPVLEPIPHKSKRAKIGEKKFKNSPLFILPASSRSEYKQHNGPVSKIKGSITIKFERLIREEAEDDSQDPDILESSLQLARIWPRMTDAETPELGKLYHINEQEDKVMVTNDAIFQQVLREQKTIQRTADVPFILWYKADGDDWQEEDGEDDTEYNEQSEIDMSSSEEELESDVLETEKDNAGSGDAAGMDTAPSTEARVEAPSTESEVVESTVVPVEAPTSTERPARASTTVPQVSSSPSLRVATRGPRRAGTASAVRTRKSTRRAE